MLLDTYMYICILLCLPGKTGHYSDIVSIITIPEMTESDRRTTAMGIGTSAVAIIIVFIIIVFLMDIPTLIHSLGCLRSK